MKKLFVVIVLVLGAYALNAQRTPVKVSDLPKGVSDSINKEYPGYTIKETAKVVENNVTTYEVEISKGMTDKTLKFDNTGKSLKSSEGKSMDRSMDKSKTTPNSPTSPSSSPSTMPNSPSSTPSSPSSSPSSPTTTPPNSK